MGQGAIFLILAGLELLVGIARDELLLGFDFKLQSFAVGFKPLHQGLSILESRLRLGCPGLINTPFWSDSGQLPIEAADFSVTVLEDEQFFDDFKHVRAVLSSARQGYRPRDSESTGVQSGFSFSHVCTA